MFMQTEGRGEIDKGKRSQIYDNGGRFEFGS